MSELVMTEIRAIRDAVNQGNVDTSERLTRIETLLAPSPGQPNRLELIEGRLGHLETGRNWLMGAWAVVSTAVGYKFLHK